MNWEVVMKSVLRKTFLTAILLSTTSPLLAARFTSISSAYTDSLMGSSYGWAISGDGRTVVGNIEVGQEVLLPDFPDYTYVEYTQTAYKWNPFSSSLTLLPFSNATGASYDGSTVVGGRYRWTEAGGAQDLGGLGTTGSAAYGVSADGNTVVGFSDGPNGREAYRWTEAGGMQGLGFLPAANNNSRASAVSADGSVVVGSSYGGAFIWTESTGMTNLATVGPLDEPFYGYPNAISADGLTVVGQSPETWIWTEAGGLQFLGMNQPAYGVSADGSIVVGGDQWSSSTGIAWIYDETNGVRNLKSVFENDYGMDLTGWTLYAALDVSDDGTKFTGVGINPLGQREAWFADIAAVPIPATVWLFGSGLIALLGLGKRKA